MAVARMLALLMVGSLLVGGPRADDDTQEQDQLQGSWDLVEIVVAGKPVRKTPIEGVKFNFMGNSLTIVPPDEISARYPKQVLRFTFDPNANPGKIDTTNLDGQHKEKTTLGIYKIEGRKLTICIANDGGARPTVFESKAGSSVALYTLHRAKRQTGQHRELSKPSGPNTGMNASRKTRSGSLRSATLAHDRVIPDVPLIV